MNTVKLIGRLGAKPDIRTFDQGKKLARISMATNESFKNFKGEWVTETNWHNLVAWGKTAEFFEENTDKGAEVSIEGKLVNRNYTDKDGNKKYITEVVIHEASLVEKKEVAQ